MRIGIKQWICVAVLAAAAAGPVLGQNPTAGGTMAADEHIKDLVVPFSAFASPEAARLHMKLRSVVGPQGDIVAVRRFYGKINDDQLAAMRKAFAVKIEPQVLGGVRADMVTPATGVAVANRNRVLISLHGGAFLTGAGSGVFVEAVPVAATARINVVTVDYRLAPEHLFPAASEDVAAVYGALLARYKPENIGIYGCSAGGVLTAQSVAWFDAHGLPRPGAVAMLCGGGAEGYGDSAYTASTLNGQPASAPITLAGLPYMHGVDIHNPLAFPIESPELLRKFPASLLIAGSRDFSMSSLTFMHRRLRAEGVEAELFVFDGLGHAFYIYPDLPESRETYDILARFFDQHLGRN